MLSSTTVIDTVADGVSVLRCDLRSKSLHSNASVLNNKGIAGELLRIVRAVSELQTMYAYSQSRPGEFHPEPLTDPDVNLSIHPARATSRRLPPSAGISEFLWLPIDSDRSRRG